MNVPQWPFAASRASSACSFRSSTTSSTSPEPTTRSASPRVSDERHGKRTYVTEFGLDGARRLAGESHERDRAALAQAAPEGARELEQITDFIFTRSS